MSVLMTVKQYAQLRGVSERLVHQWIAKGAVTVQRLAPRTHVRIVVEETELTIRVLPADATLDRADGDID